MQKILPTGRERTFGEHELIVSKTDTRGVITYLGKPHNLVRHPEMPRGLFRLLWDRLKQGHEVFAMVVNLASNGDYYWVLAHVTPSLSSDGTVLGYHSNRRYPHAEMVKEFAGLYSQMIEIERQHSNPKLAAEASLAYLQARLDAEGLDYDRFFFAKQNAVLAKELV